MSTSQIQAVQATENVDPSPVRWPVGTKFVSLTDEMDDDDDVERITPAGNIWEVIMIHGEGDGRHWMIVCPATGACICPDEKALLTDFRLSE